MSDKQCPYIKAFAPDKLTQCAIVKSAYPCYGFAGPCAVREAYDCGFARGKGDRPKGPPDTCRVFVGNQDVTEQVLKRMRTFKKIPITIRAAQMNYPFEVDTLEGRMKGGYGDFVIQGVKQELYPCAQDIFLQIHETPESIKLAGPRPAIRRTR